MTKSRSWCVTPSTSLSCSCHLTQTIQWASRLRRASSTTEMKELTPSRSSWTMKSSPARATAGGNHLATRLFTLRSILFSITTLPSKILRLHSMIMQRLWRSRSIAPKLQSPTQQSWNSSVKTFNPAGHLQNSSTRWKLIRFINQPFSWRMLTL